MAHLKKQSSSSKKLGFIQSLYMHFNLFKQVLHLLPLALNLLSPGENAFVFSEVVFIYLTKK